MLALPSQNRDTLPLCAMRMWASRTLTQFQTRFSVMRNPSEIGIVGDHTFVLNSGRFSSRNQPIFAQNDGQKFIILRIGTNLYTIIQAPTVYPVGYKLNISDKRQNGVREVYRYPFLQTAVRRNNGPELFCHQSTARRALERLSKHPLVLRIAQRSAHCLLGL